MVDTVLLCQTKSFEDRSDKCKKKELNVTYSDSKAVKDMYIDIENKLKKISNEKYPYVIVSGHYPIWSVAEHGPTQCLVDNLRPLLHKYKVNAYFAGIKNILNN